MRFSATAIIASYKGMESKSVEIAFNSRNKKCRRYTRAFIAIKASLGLGDVIGVSGGDVEEVAVGIVESMTRLNYCALKEASVAHPRRPSKPRDRFLMKKFDLGNRQEIRLAHKASLRMSSA